jgi:hypothetical protein
MKLAKFFFTVIVLGISILLLPHLFAFVGFAGAALFTPSPIMNELRKKAGSAVFSKNHYGQFIRKRVKGINPKTAKQILLRANFGGVAKSWKGLTAARILAWNAYGKVYTLRNRLGQAITHTGEVWYIALNRVLYTIGSAALLDAPSLSAVPPALPTTPALVVVSGVSITITLGATLPGTAALRIYASAGISAGKTYNSNYRYLGTMLAADAGTKNISALYTAVYGVLPLAGNKLFVKLINTDNTNGLSNVPQVLTATT